MKTFVSALLCCSLLTGCVAAEPVESASPQQLQELKDEVALLREQLDELRLQSGLTFQDLVMQLNQILGSLDARIERMEVDLGIKTPAEPPPGPDEPYTDDDSTEEHFE